MYGESVVCEVSGEGEAVASVVPFAAEDEGGASEILFAVSFGFEGENFIGGAACGVFHEDEGGDAVFIDGGFVHALYGAA